MGRFIVGAVVLVAILLIVVTIRTRGSSPWVKCARCDGEGAWEGSRRREKCEACDGSGRVRRAGTPD